MKMIMVVGRDNGRSSPIKINFSFSFFPISLSSNLCRCRRGGRGVKKSSAGRAVQMRDSLRPGARVDPPRRLRASQRTAQESKQRADGLISSKIHLACLLLKYLKSLF